MKNKKTFFICIFPLAFIAVLLIIFSVLGSIYRTGYLNEIKLIENNTYSFRISYYNKVFRNSDIYNVYLDTKTTINDNSFIKNIKMDKKGSPFGTLTTDKAIDVNKKIDNIKYTLKIKNIIYFYAFIIYILIFTFLYFFKNIKNILEIFINFIIVNKKTAIPVLVISSIFIILLLALIILGSIPRTGYLNEIKLIENNVYSFRISYYNKVFRNSDIYNVYLDTKKTINDNSFIKNIKMDKKGSPFGTLTTDKAIDINKKIDNIKYTLKIKNTIYFYAFIIYLFSIFLFYGIWIVKENKLVLVSASLLIIIQIFIYFSLYNYFRLIS
ncbi:hypothetical protein [Brachyspira innocens]|uniref:hypothetical protein n=1 Tax=Brachyspira innocens TaxID=13264 RepID=UPI00036B97B9|nr:hypothetical protein [Brachyspira innocens]